MVLMKFQIPRNGDNNVHRRPVLVATGPALLASDLACINTNMNTLISGKNPHIYKYALIIFFYNYV